MKILAIDLAQKKSVACVYEAFSGSHVFRSVPTTAKAIHDLVAVESPARVVIEIGPLAGWVHDLVRSMEVQVQVANPNHEAWRWRKVKHKSDRQDAIKTAKLSAMNQLPTVHMPPSGVRAWRELIQYRQTLVKRQTQIKNSIRAILVRHQQPLAAGQNGWTKRSVAKLGQLATARGGEIWRCLLAEELVQLDGVQASMRRVEQQLADAAGRDDRVAQLRTVPSVGPRLAETVVAVIDDPWRFRSGKQVASYGGLTQRQFQSGAMDRRGGITGQGHRELRAMLIQAAWIGVRRNPWMKSIYEQVKRGTESRKKIAIVAVARRLLICLWVMLRDGTRWREAGSLRLVA